MKSKMTDIAKLSDSEIVAKTEVLKKSLFQMKMSSVVSKMEKPHQKRDAKKELARLLTAKRQREMSL